MSRVFIDGFESGGIGLWESLNAGSYAVNAVMGGKDGNYALVLNGRALRIALSANGEYYVAAKISAAIDTNQTFLAFYNGATALGSLRYNAAVAAYQVALGNPGSGSSGTVLATGTTYIPGSTTFNLEWWYKPATDGTGRTIVKVNGVVQFDFTGVTAASPGNINYLHLEGITGVSYVDNVVIDNSEWPGTTNIQALKPNAAGTNSQFIPSVDGVANYTMVDEVPAVDTDYVRTNDENTLDLYGLTDFVPPQSAVPWKIKCIQSQARGEYEGVANVTGLNLAVKTNGVTSESATQPLTTVFSDVAAIWSLNPATGLSWTIAELDALEAGFKAKL
jgi:hypothetical protein